MKKRIRMSTKSQMILLMFAWMTLMPLLASFGSGCSSSDAKPYDQALVSTFAELTMMYEKEKMTNRITDSLYQIKVKDFFDKKGYKQETFRSVIDELSENPTYWKMFLQDVTKAVDSIRALQPEQ